MLDKATWKKMRGNHKDFFELLDVAKSFSVLLTIWVVPSCSVGVVLDANTEWIDAAIVTAVIVFAILWALVMAFTLMYLEARKQLIEEAREKLESHNDPHHFEQAHGRRWGG